MKKNWLFLIFGLLLATQSQATDLFAIDEQQLNTQLTQIIEMEKIIETSNFSPEAIAISSNFIIDEYPENQRFIVEERANEKALAFCAGFCCNVFGIAYIFRYHQDRTKLLANSIWGGVACVSITSLAWAALILMSNSGSGYYCGW